VTEKKSKTSGTKSVKKGREMCLICVMENLEIEAGTRADSGIKARTMTHKSNTREGTGEETRATYPDATSIARCDDTLEWRPASEENVVFPDGRCVGVMPPVTSSAREPGDVTTFQTSSR